MNIRCWVNRIRHKFYARSAWRPLLYGKDVRSFQEMINQLRKEGYFSQYGQDKWVFEQLLPNKECGLFVDIGAHDGVAYSNTYILEKSHQWQGLAVEPIPEVYEKLRKNRKCEMVNACVSEKTGKRLFRINAGYDEMLSGLVNEYHPNHLKRMSGDEYREVEVNCFCFNDLMKKYEIHSIDYLSIDVEGAELSILENIDYKAHNINVIGVENNYSDYRIPKLLTSSGFTLHSIVGDDEFYVRESSLL